MKLSREEIINLVLVSSLTVVLYDIVVSYLPSAFYLSFQSQGRIGRWIFMVGVFALTVLIAAVPGAFILRLQKMKHPFGTVIFGAPIAAVLLFLLWYAAASLPLVRPFGFYLAVCGGFVAANYLCKYLGKLGILKKLH